jgi:O-antigen/teichoic acid export membrane protein
VSKIGRNTVWNLLGQVAPAIAALFTVPILIHGLGTERFGVLTLIWLIVGYFGIFDLGLGRALTQLLAERLGRNDHESTAPLVWTALGLMAGLGIIGTVVAGVAAPALQNGLKVPPSLRAETLRAIYLLALSVPLVVSTTGFRGVLEARQRFDLANVVRLASGVYTYVGPVLTLAFSRSLVPITIVLLAGRAATWVAYLAMCFRELPEMRRRLAFDPTYVKPLLRVGGWMTVSNVVGPFLVYLDRFLIATIIGATAVAYYVTPFEIVTRLLILPWAFAGVLFPLIASTFTPNPDGSARLFSRGMRLIFLTLFPFVLCAIAFAHEGLAAWVGESFAAHSDVVLRWLAIGVFMNGIAQVPFATIQAAGRPDLTARIHLIELPLYVPTLWWMAHRWGIEGAAVAWTMRGGLDLVVQSIVATQLLPGRRQVGGVVARVLGVAGFAALAFAAVAFIPRLSSRAVVVVAALLAVAVLGWNHMLDSDDRSYIRGIVVRASARFRVA